MKESIEKKIEIEPEEDKEMEIVDLSPYFMGSKKRKNITFKEVLEENNVEIISEEDWTDKMEAYELSELIMRTAKGVIK